MKILLIKPSQLDDNEKPSKYKKSLYPPLSLAIIDRLTPERHKVRVVDDVVENIDYSGDYDLVGISVMTAQAERAYQIADRFRSKGIKVILGGIHPSAVPDEAKKHADAVAIGEVEDTWEHILADFENNAPKEFYRAETLPDLKKPVIPKWDNINLKVYVKGIGKKYPRMPIFITRGCTFDCTFCCVSKFFGRTYRAKPVANVIAEIDAMEGKDFFFVDDNILCDFDYSRELFNALIPKKIAWFSQMSTTVLKSPDLIDLAARSGCDSMQVGIESLNKESLKSINKCFNHPEAYEELFARMKKARIIACPTVIFGFDEDTPEQFELTIEFLRKTKVEAPFFVMLTPFPATTLYEDLKRAGRLVDTDWSHYDEAHMVYQPKNFTVEEYSRLFWKHYRNHYSYGNIAKRLVYITAIASNPLRNFSESLIYNMYNRVKVFAYKYPISDGIFSIRKKYDE